jgi:CDP-6-deoxy-D-xylo-4-hexulose-3-dehydrase
MIVEHLEKKGIQTRMLFAGNLVKHPSFDEMRESGTGYRVIGDLEVTDRIMRDTFWLGVYPGLDEEMLDYVAETARRFVESSCR